MRHSSVGCSGACPAGGLPHQTNTLDPYRPNDLAQLYKKNQNQNHCLAQAAQAVTAAAFAVDVVKSLQEEQPETAPSGAASNIYWP
jgi:hypothetical protein